MASAMPCHAPVPCAPLQLPPLLQICGACRHMLVSLLRCWLLLVVARWPACTRAAFNRESLWAQHWRRLALVMSCGDGAARVRCAHTFVLVWGNNNSVQKTKKKPSLRDESQQLAVLTKRSANQHAPGGGQVPHGCCILCSSVQSMGHQMSAERQGHMCLPWHE